MCRSTALLVEAESLANLGSWENDLTRGEEIWSANLSELLGFGRTLRRVSENLFWSLVHPHDREMVRTIIECALKDHLPTYEYQARYILPDNRERVLFTRGKLAFNSANCLVRRMGVTQDVTMAVEADRALLASEERYRDLVENSNDLICTHDLNGFILSMNEPPARILGYSSKDLIGRRVADFLQPERRSAFDEYLLRIQRDGYDEGLMALSTRTGELRVWEYRNTLRTDGVPSPIIRGMAHDITERLHYEKALRDSQAELQRLSIRLLQLQDSERRRVSLTLHEKTAQSLVGMQLILRALGEMGAHLSPSVLWTINQCSEITAQAIEEVRSLSYLLHPPLLEEGLAMAVAWHVSRFAKSSGIEVSVEIPKDFGRLPDTHETALFRIVQECLANIDRHSGSRWAKIKIERDDGSVTLVVEDGGRGRSEQFPFKSNTFEFGMLVMRERVRQLHGRFSFSSSRTGVVVQTSLPTPHLELPQR